VTQPEDLKGRPFPAPPADAGERIADILANSLQDEYGSVSTHLGAIADNLHDNLRAYDEDGVDRNITIVDAIIGIGAQLRSPNEIDSNGEVANVVDAGFAIARAIDRLATAVEEMSSAKASRTETPKSWSASHRRSAEVSRETKAERKLTSRLEA